MAAKKFERKKKEELPVIAICYDFDKTLSPDDMQAQGFIQSIGYDVKKFWQESNGLAEQNDMDQNLAYMYKMIEESAGKVVFTREKLIEYGAKVKLFPGVDTWFERIRKFGQKHNVIIEHYIISSGLKEMIEGTEVAQNGAFEKIYASSFYYNNKGVAIWPAQVVNYTNKTQFLFRIEKGVLDVNDPGVNEFFPPDKIRIPFRNIIYIGDSDTDIPCMKLVNSLGGYSIGVYNPDTGDKEKVYKMMRENRIKYFVQADYSEDSELDKLIKLIIIRSRFNELIEDKHINCATESEHDEQILSEGEYIKIKLINSLKESPSFATTHTIIGEMSLIEKWSQEHIKKILKIALDNCQIRLILTDSDIKEFYQKLIDEFNYDDDLVSKVKNILNSDS